jgi:Zinc-binding dehydrogenase
MVPLKSSVAFQSNLSTVWIKVQAWKLEGGDGDSTKRKKSNMFKAKAYSAVSATSSLASTVIPRRDPTPRDVQIEILRRAKVGPGMKVGVVGLGGLGHMGVKLAKAMGAHVAVFTTSESKRKDALRLGADEVILSKSKEEMGKHTGTFDFILDCVAAEHDINAYLQLLDLNGKITLVGAPEKPLPVSAFALRR